MESKDRESPDIRILVSRDVVFNEENFPWKKNQQRNQHDIDSQSDSQKVSVNFFEDCDEKESDETKNNIEQVETVEAKPMTQEHEVHDEENAGQVEEFSTTYRISWKITNLSVIEKREV